MEDIKWMESANCSGTDTDFFFTEGDSTTYSDKVLIERICSNCDVKKECKEYSLRYNVLGWWANTSEYARKVERRKLGIIPIPIVSDGVYE